MYLSFLKDSWKSIWALTSYIFSFLLYSVLLSITEWLRSKGTCGGRFVQFSCSKLGHLEQVSPGPCPVGIWIILRKEIWQHLCEIYTIFSIILMVKKSFLHLGGIYFIFVTIASHRSVTACYWILLRVWLHLYSACQMFIHFDKLSPEPFLLSLNSPSSQPLLFWQMLHFKGKNGRASATYLL